MKTAQIHVGQALTAAKQIFDVNPDAMKAVDGSDAMQELGASITVINASGTEQGTRSREARGVVRRRRAQETALLKKFMTPASKFARARLVGAPDFAALTPAASALKGERLVLAALSVVKAATPHAAALVAAKFPADFLAKFEQAAESVRASMLDAKKQRMQHAGAGKALTNALRSGRAAVAVLDGLIAHLLDGNDRLAREWQEAKRVQRPPVHAAQLTPLVSQEVHTVAT